MPEEDYEWYSDLGVIEQLRLSESCVARDAASRLLHRRLPRAVYRAPLLTNDEQQKDAYHARQGQMKGYDIFSVKGRRELEAELARTTSLSPDDVIVYCPEKAPGYQLVEHHVSTAPGSATAVDHVKSPYYTLSAKHLGLWELWVFSIGDPDRDSMLAAAAYERFGFENHLAHDRR